LAQPLPWRIEHQIIAVKSSLRQNKLSMKKVVVIGAGIGGLTAGALLAKRGYEVVIFDQAIVPGGCDSRFQLI
jgi:ribulose 1,5-bisphosphate synthetase/thiazole synthase